MAGKLTPMMEQYMEIKKQYQDTILFFRLGDFYEMFFDDAITASRVLEITLTKKNCGIDNEKAPMCGVPYHSVESYLAKLVENGYKVAICEQVEDPAEAKGIVKREVTQIVTPGTLTEQSMLKDNENNYLASVYLDEDGSGILYTDISTGELRGVEFSGHNHGNILLNELARIMPKEIILDNGDFAAGMRDEIQELTKAYVDTEDPRSYDEETGKRLVLKQFKTNSVKGIGLEEKPLLKKALYGLLSYLNSTQKQQLNHLNTPDIYELGDHMNLDKASIRNLEITEPLFEKQVKGSLLGVLDMTHTAMGSRTMKKWLKEPLINAQAINNRLDAVEEIKDNILIKNHIKEHLKGVYDLERLAGRLSYGNANGRDLIALKNSVSILPDIKSELDSLDVELLNKINENISTHLDIYNMIDSSIIDDPPFTVREGGLIKSGFSEELDELKDSIKDGQQWIASLESIERERTGIKNLKVGFNKVFGYYIDVTKSNLDMVPDDYIRKQTLVNNERFITPELKEVESKVLNAETKINKMEYEIFNSIKEELTEEIPQLQQTSTALAQLDVLTSFAEAAEKYDYAKPEVDNNSEITIEKGRHPVIENSIKDGVFVPNDTYLNKENESMLLITGPNMAGKSTYMRQTALIVLMAQAGSFVPAEKAKIGISDRIYTRIGASDNLAQGESTFYVEMSELAYILNTATKNSLVILDEIGRGTSTYDGLSIAWAVLEYLCNKDFKVRTLFATHYQELTVLEDKLPGMKNLNVDVSDDKGEIVFLHKIVEGSASRSYGIHVAKLAGVPKSLLENAEYKLKQLEDEKKEIDIDTGNQIEEVSQQISLFDFAPNPVIEKLKSLDIMEIKPSEAISILEDLKEAAEE